eukprot:scaffold34636_cov18-Tisochrysis_lutea.AAC.2
MVTHRFGACPHNSTGTSSGPSAYPVVVQGKNVTVEAILYNGGTRYGWAGVGVLVHFLLGCACACMLRSSPNSSFPAPATCLVVLNICSTAMDVTYEDVLPKNAELVEGSLQASFPRIAMGSSARHSYVVRFTSGRGKQVMFLPQASVAYVSDTESTTQGRYATFTLVRTAEDWTKLGIFVGVVGGLLGVNWLVKQRSEKLGNRHVELDESGPCRCWGGQPALPSV